MLTAPESPALTPFNPRSGKRQGEIMQHTASEIRKIAEALPIPKSKQQSIGAHSAFCLPKISPAVPSRQVTDTHLDLSAEIARRMIDAGVININTLPDDICTVHEVVQVGVQQWVHQRIPEFNVLDLSLSLWYPDAKNSFIEAAYSESPGDSPEPTDTFGLVFDGVEYLNGYVMEAHAKYLELHQPGLFRTAILTIMEATRRSIDIRMPEDIFWLFQHQWYSQELIPDDKDAIEALLEVHGVEDESMIEAFLPSRVVDMLGGELCFTHVKLKSKQSQAIKPRELKRIAKQSQDATVVSTAQAIIDLRFALQQAEKRDIRLPDLTSTCAETIEAGCTLMYRFNQIIIDELDAQNEHAQQAGVTTSVIGIDELPNDTESLKAYFDDLDILLRVVHKMDQLLKLITTPYRD